MSLIVIDGNRYDLIDPELVAPFFFKYHKVFIEYDKKGYNQKDFIPEIAEKLMSFANHTTRKIQDHSDYGFDVRKFILEDPNHLGRTPQQGEPTDLDLSQIPKSYLDDLEEIRQINLFELPGQIGGDSDLSLIINLYEKFRRRFYGFGMVNTGYLLYPYAPNAVPIITYIVQYIYSLKHGIRHNPKIIISQMAEDGSKSKVALKTIRDCLPQEYRFLKLLRIFQVLISEVYNKDTILKPLESG